MSSKIFRRCLVFAAVYTTIIIVRLFSLRLIKAMLRILDAVFPKDPRHQIYYEKAPVGHINHM